MRPSGFREDAFGRPQAPCGSLVTLREAPPFSPQPSAERGSDAAGLLRCGHRPPPREAQGTVTAQHTEHLGTNSITSAKMLKKICSRFASARRRGPLGRVGEVSLFPLTTHCGVPVTGTETRSPPAADTREGGAGRQLRCRLRPPETQAGHRFLLEKRPGCREPPGCTRVCELLVTSDHAKAGPAAAGPPAHGQHTAGTRPAHGWHTVGSGF